MVSWERILILVLLFLAAASADSCEEWGGRSVGGSHKCFRAGTSTTWDINHAQRLCRSYGGTVASIESQTEQELFHQMFLETGNNRAWIGLVEGESEWRWLDGSMLSFTDWQRGQPDGHRGAGGCAVMWNRHKPGDWKNEPCDTQGLGFVCSRNFDCENRGGRPVAGSTKCFKLHNSTADDFSDAHAKCQDENMDLASISSANANAVVQFMVTELGQESAWIGLTDIGHEGKFSWIDGTALNFTNFAEGEPDNWQNDQHCVVIHSGNGPPGTDRVGGEWDDALCYTTGLPFVCSWDRAKNESEQKEDGEETPPYYHWVENRTPSQMGQDSEPRRNDRLNGWVIPATCSILGLVVLGMGLFVWKRQTKAEQVALGSFARGEPSAPAFAGIELSGASWTHATLAISTPTQHSEATRAGPESQPSLRSATRSDNHAEDVPSHDESLVVSVTPGMLEEFGIEPQIGLSIQQIEEAARMASTMEEDTNNNSMIEVEDQDVDYD